MRRRGFTLLEMSIVLVIIAVVVGGGMTIFSGSLQKRQLQETQFKLKAIQKALLDYRITYNRIPCPADVTLALPTLTVPTYFGFEAGSVINSVWVPDAGICATYGTYSSDALTTTAANSVAADFVNLLAPTGTTTSGSTSVINMSSITGIVAGMAVSGGGIPAGDTVASASGSTVVLTTAATASATSCPADLR